MNAQYNYPVALNGCKNIWFTNCLVTDQSSHMHIVKTEPSSK